MLAKTYKNILIGISALIVIGVGMLLYHLSTSSQRINEKTAILEAEQFMQSVQSIKAIYTKDVINRVLKEDVSNPHVLGGKLPVPLPFAFTMKIANDYNYNENNIQTFSKFPFPSKSNRSISGFQSRALEIFTKIPLEVDSYYEIDEKTNTINYAVPDIMNDKSCVSCHNNHPQSPKTNWKLGDVRGAISIQKPIKVNPLLEIATSRSLLIIAALFLLVIMAGYIVINKDKSTIEAVKKIEQHILYLEKGELPDEALEVVENEITPIIKGVNAISKYIKDAADFSVKIGQGKFDIPFSTKSNNDSLGIALLNMRKNLIHIKEEDDKRSWGILGMAKFAELLRTNSSDIEQLSNKIIAELVKYTNANQGSIFVINEEVEANKYMELKACYAWERKKYKEKSKVIGEGLVGRAWQEAQTIYLTNVPNSYISITSGLGASNPSCVLIVPMKIENDVFGIVELAFFHQLEQYQIHFVEQLAESIASTILNTRVNQKTSILLTEANEMTEEMQAQEEEMRQNMEELQATQEEMDKAQREMQSQQIALNNSAIVSEADKQGKITFVNDIFCQLSEYSRDELMGQPHSIVRHPNMSSEIFKDLWATIGKGNVWRGRVKNKTKSGGFYWVDAIITPIIGTDGKPEKYIGIRYDISEQVKQEELVSKLMDDSMSKEFELTMKINELEKELKNK